MGFAECGGHPARWTLPAHSSTGCLRALYEYDSKPLLRGAERGAPVALREHPHMFRDGCSLHPTGERVRSRRTRLRDRNQCGLSDHAFLHTGNDVHIPEGARDAVLEASLEVPRRSQLLGGEQTDLLGGSHVACRLVRGRGRTVPRGPPRHHRARRSDSAHRLHNDLLLHPLWTR